MPERAFGILGGNEFRLRQDFDLRPKYLARDRTDGRPVAVKLTKYEIEKMFKRA